MTSKISALLVCSLCSLFHCINRGYVQAAPWSNSNQHNDAVDQERRARGSLSASTKSQGPRGTKRQLQDYMGGTLAEGYGGNGGVTKDQESLPMKVPFVPAVPTQQPFNTPAPTPTPITTPTSASATSAPTDDNREITYVPGMLTVMERDLILSQGLTSRILALSGQPVVYGNGTQSVADFHVWPDGAATFVDNRPQNKGGWLYVSNMEDSTGGVGALTFNKDGEVINYGMILTGTKWNCNGGRTPWGYVVVLCVVMRFILHIV